MKKIILLLGILIASKQLIAQGCSDAGFCSLSVLKNQQNNTALKNSLSIGIGYGNGEQNTTSVNPYIEYSRKLNSKFSFQTKIAAAYTTGFVGNNFNAGDVFSLITYAQKLKNTKNSFTWLGGIKLPLTTSNDKNNNGKPLPLDYQSSLGTFDVIAGFNYISNQKWEINTGLQIPVINSNKNTFFPDEYSDSKIVNFAPTNNFERKADLLFRIGHYFKTPKSITLKPNLLAVYHLANDTYEDRFGKRKTINNSAGLTLNAGFVATKYFNAKNELEFVAATPLVVRDIRPDGLTRSAVINLQYKFKF